MIGIDGDCDGEWRLLDLDDVSHFTRFFDAFP